MDLRIPLFMTRIIFTLTFSLFCGLLLSQTADELIRDLQQATSAKEKMLINFQIAETYMRGSDREKAIEDARTAHQSAIEQSNNGVAARSAYLIGDAYERLRNDKNAETWYKTCLNFAKSAGDFDLIVQSVKKRSKIATMASLYPDKLIMKMAIVAHKKNHKDLVPAASCGACRQVMAEFEDRQKKPFEVVMMVEEGKWVKCNSAAALLPFVFTKDNLESSSKK